MEGGAKGQARRVSSRYAGAMRREPVGLIITSCSCSVFFLVPFSTPRVSVKSHAFFVFFGHGEGRLAILLCYRRMVITDLDLDLDFDLNGCFPL